MDSNFKFVKNVKGSSITNLDITDCFNSAYETYLIDITDVDVTVESTLRMRLYDATGLNTDDAYAYQRHNFFSYSSFTYTSDTEEQFDLGYIGDASTGAVGGVRIWLHNSQRSVYTQATVNAVGFDDGNGLQGNRGALAYQQNDVITGFRLFMASGDFDKINVNVFGVN